MLAKIKSASCFGVEAYLIEIEVDISNGLPQVSIVGLPDQAVKESKDRIRTAIKNSGYHFPSRKKIIVNLAPADIKKEGPSFDLPIALGILAASGQIKKENLSNTCTVGELALDGTLREIKGSLPIALFLHNKVKNFILPKDNVPEACLQRSLAIFGPTSLSETVQHLNDEVLLPRCALSDLVTKGIERYSYDFSDVKGQQLIKRAIEIAVAGGHNILMVGPPGAGKTMLAKRIPTIFPKLNPDEMLEVTKILSISGSLTAQQRKTAILQRPFRAPHHSTSLVALIGGGSIPKPGEISLAHNGVLFLDELPEFNRNVIESLRAPLEDGTVTIARAKQVISFPSKFALVCAMNPCPCGYLGDSIKECGCSSSKIEKYHAKLSGPILDRIDIHISVCRVPYQELHNNRSDESSAHVRARVEKARALQLSRLKHLNNHYTNGQMDSKEINFFCKLTKEAQALLRAAMHEFGFSVRSHNKILKVSRTIADMRIISRENKEDVITAEDISEAIHYRILDRNWWK